MALSTKPTATSEAYVAVQQSPEFQSLRRKFRGFVFPATAFFLAWYFLYVLLSIFAPGFMNKHVAGNVSVGLIFGFLQFVTTFAITFMYARWANREFDPAAEALGDHLDGSAK
ncbi:DUF485 domain-containing protein [Nostocoides jenkinsii]|uniref:Integral membrane protein n=1 Tax=Nostocoides jenkinsii Ben 74 TaxID=1193518 RepID=A0A077MFX3_9MICO|nr:conserved hypothetical protein [Tetrasphaera jenkinsii Ben 74]